MINISNLKNFLSLNDKDQCLIIYDKIKPLYIDDVEIEVSVAGKKYDIYSAVSFIEPNHVVGEIFYSIKLVGLSKIKHQNPILQLTLCCKTGNIESCCLYPAILSLLKFKEVESTICLSIEKKISIYKLDSLINYSKDTKLDRHLNLLTTNISSNSISLAFKIVFNDIELAVNVYFDNLASYHCHYYIDKKQYNLEYANIDYLFETFFYQAYLKENYNLLDQSPNQLKIAEILAI